MRLLEIPGVQGVGIGDAGTTLAITVYVEGDSETLRRRIPPSLEGVPVILETSGEFQAF